MTTKKEKENAGDASEQQPGDKSGPDGFSNIEPKHEPTNDPPPPAPATPPTPAAPTAETKGRMAPTPAAERPQPGDSVYERRPEPDLIDEPHRWALDSQVMIDEIEKHIKESHGMESDKAMLREVVAFIKRYIG